jgi:hypothetical protein
MATPEPQEFPIVNGHCSIADGTIHLEPDPVTTRIDRWFGRNLLRRSLIFALVFGAPLTIAGVFLINQGHFTEAVWPIALAAMFAISPVFYIGYSNPTKIAICDIEAVTSHPPKRIGTLASFEIRFLSNGSHKRTTIALPYAEYDVRVKCFRHACAVLTRSGVMLVGNGHMIA